MNVFKSVHGLVSLAILGFLNAPLCAQEGAGLLHALGLNASSVDQYDVLIRQEMLKDIADNDNEKIVRHLRLRIDRKNQRFLGLSRVDREVISPESDNPKRSFYASGFVWKDGQCFTTKYPASPKRSKASLLTTLYTQTIPDIRMIGVAPYPHVFLPKGTAGDFESWLGAISEMKNFEELESSSDHVLIQQEFAFLNKAQDKLIRTWKFDPKSLMPSEMRSRTQKVKDGKLSVEKQFWEKYEWKEIGNAYVPISVVGDRLTSTLPIEYRRLSNRERHEQWEKLQRQGVAYIPYTAESSIKLHWFSVGQPLTEDDFSLDYLRSVTSLHEQTDPVASGADTIVER